MVIVVNTVTSLLLNRLAQALAVKKQNLLHGPMVEACCLTLCLVRDILALLDATFVQMNDPVMTVVHDPLIV